jgi:hypothetical protein
VRTPLRQKSRLARAQVSSVQSIPAPIGGWNARDALADMAPTDAIALENWFPRPSYCEIRGGYTTYASGMVTNGKTLATYNTPAGTHKMYVASQDGVYDVSAAGFLISPVAVRTNGKHQWVNFGNGTSNYLIMVNGVDKPLYFDGTTWVAVDNATSPALSGITSSNLVHVNVFKGRLFFVEKDSLSFWYLAAGAAGGALTEFALDAECAKGGYLVAMATWTVDGGDGPDDRAVFVTSEGEVLIYQGTNPASATSWAKIGSYHFGRPLGRRCFTKFGGDIVLLTENGAFPLSQALQSVTIDYTTALSNKIEKAFTEVAANYGSVFGWEVLVFPKQAALIVNIPHAEDGTHDQYVMNTISKAWCKFTGWDAEDFVVYNGDLYFTFGRAVVKAWNGASDGGLVGQGNNNVVAYAKTAFSYFGRPGLQKAFSLFRPVLSVNGTLTFLTDLDVDFRDTTITGTATYSVVTGAVWDTDHWDVGRWGSGLEVVKQWTSPRQYTGYCAAGKIKIATDYLTVQWMACDYVWQVGGPM